jgi:hypothetical protein
VKEVSLRRGASRGERRRAGVEEWEELLHPGP